MVFGRSCLVTFQRAYPTCKVWDLMGHGRGQGLSPEFEKLYLGAEKKRREAMDHP